MKLLLAVLVITFSLGSLRAQDSEINDIRERYLSWLDGRDVDYDDPYTMIRYNFIISAYGWASDYSSFDLDSPGAEWDLTTSADKNELRNVCARLIELCTIYNIEGPESDPNPHFEDPETLDLIFQVFDFIEGNGLDGDTDFGDYFTPGFELYGLGGTAIIRSASYSNSMLLMRDELLETGRLDAHLEALDNITFFWSPENPHFDFVNAGTNADGIKVLSQGRLIYTLCQEDGTPDRIEDMEHYVAFLDNALKIAPGWADTFKPDLMTYHHRGIYSNNYGATALMSVSAMQWILSGSAYELSEESSQNIRDVLLNYRKFTLGYSMPSTVCGRGPTSTEYMLPLAIAFANSYQSNPVDNSECGREFTRLFYMDSTLITNKLIKNNGVGVGLYHTLGGMKIMMETIGDELETGEVLSGAYQFPYAGMTTHKTAEWMISQKGTDKHIWHYEGNPSQNAFGRYSSAGYMEILNSTHPEPRVHSGLSWDGYNWSHRPGTTVHYMTTEEIYEEANDDRSTNSKDFLVNGVFGESGVFAMDYEDYNTEEGMSVKKSTYFFDDYALVLTNNIDNVDGEHEIHSTFFQTYLMDNTVYSHVEEDSVNGVDYFWGTDESGIVLTDGVNNAYYIKETDGDSLFVTRSHQNSVGPNGSSLTEGDYVQAWVNHGVNPEGSTSLVYVIQINGGIDGAKYMEENFDDLFQIESLEDELHMVKYLPDSIAIIIAYQANDALNYGHVKAIDNDGVIFTQPIDVNTLKVGFTDANMGLLDDDEWYPYNAMTFERFYEVPTNHTVTVTIEGEWDLGEASENVTLFFNGTDTELTFSTKNRLSEECTLVKPSTDGIAESELKPCILYPNPAQDEFRIFGENLSEGDIIELVDINGRLIKSWVFHNYHNVYSLSDLHTGVYFVQFQTGNYLPTRLIKQ